MNAIELAEAMETRARIRRQITSRENTGDRLSTQLEQAATMLRQQQAEIEALHNLVKEQDKKIIDLAFDLEYTKRNDEFVKKASKK